MAVALATVGGPATYVLEQELCRMEVLIFVVALIVGVLGSMLGIGGGVLLVPLLTGIFGIPIKTAIGASIVSVIATSSVAGTVYGGHGLSHTRLALVLDIAATLGALGGGIMAVLLSPDLLEMLFAAVLIYVSYRMRRLPTKAPAAMPTGLLDTSYTDPVSNQTIIYGVRSLPLGMAASFLAGNLSSLFGIGGGIIKVPVMRLVMGMPLRAAIATSNYMIGVTAATSAVIYYQRGFLDPASVIPTALGVLVGAQLGTYIGAKVRSQSPKLILQGLLLVLAVQMIYQGVAR